MHVCFQHASMRRHDSAMVPQYAHLCTLSFYICRSAGHTTVTVPFCSDIQSFTPCILPWAQSLTQTLVLHHLMLGQATQRCGGSLLKCNYGIKPLRLQASSIKRLRVQATRMTAHVAPMYADWSKGSPHRSEGSEVMASNPGDPLCGPHQDAF